MNISFIPLPGIRKIYYCRDGLIPVEGDDCAGFMDRLGRFVVPPQYRETAYRFSEGLAGVREPAEGGRWGYVDTRGMLAIPFEYDMPAWGSDNDFSEGLALVCKKTADGGYRYEYIDRAGRAAGDFAFTEGARFSHGLACVRTEDYAWRFIRPDGGFAFDYICRYHHSPFIFTEGFAPVLFDGTGWGFIDTEGTHIGLCNYGKTWAFSGGLAGVGILEGYTDEEENPKALYRVGYVDASGGEIIAPQYGEGYPFREGLARVNLDHHNWTDGTGRFGFIDRSGRRVIPCEYDKAEDFSEGLAPVCRGKKWGYMDQRGGMVTDFRYDYAGPFSRGVAAVGIYGRPGGSYGFIDTMGSEVLPLEYEWASTIGEGLGEIETGGSGAGVFELNDTSRRMLVLFGDTVEAGADEVEQALTDAVDTALEAVNEHEAHDAWNVLDGLMNKFPAKIHRLDVLKDISEKQVHPALLELIAVDIYNLGDNETAAKLMERCAAQSHDRVRLYLALQSVYMKLGRFRDAEKAGKKAEKISHKFGSKKIKRPGTADTEPERPDQSMPPENIQKTIDRMHTIVNEGYALFAKGKKLTRMEPKIREAVDLEQELLKYWMSVSASGRDIPRKRGELSASTLYICHLRQTKRYLDAVQWFRQVTADRNLLRQCVRDFPETAENMLNNGIGALLDTKDEEDLAYGGDLLRFIDSEIAPFKTALLPCACACVAAQLGEHGRALEYLRAGIDIGDRNLVISDGNSNLRVWARTDPDLAPLRPLQEFQKLVGKIK